MSDSSILSCWCILSIFFSSLFSPLPLSMLITIPVFPPFSPSHPLSQKLLLALIWSRCYIWGIWLHLREGNCRGERKRFSLWFITFWLGCSLLWYYCKPCQVSLVLKSIWNCVFWCKTSREPEFIFFIIIIYTLIVILTHIVPENVDVFHLLYDLCFLICHDDC